MTKIQEIKIHVYNSNGTEKTDIKTVDNIKNLQELSFDENINGGSGAFDLELDETFDNTLYSKGDLLEYVIFSDEHKNGLHKFTGYITGIQRFYSRREGEYIRLNVSGIVGLLNEYTFARNYDDDLNLIVDDILANFYLQYDFTGNMKYCGTSLFKNGITYDGRFEVETDGTFTENLVQLLRGYRFRISPNGTILGLPNYTFDSGASKKIFITLDEDIINIEIDTDNETTIELISDNLEINVGDTIEIQNISDNLRLTDETIKHVNFGIDRTIIGLGDVKTLQEVF